MSQKSTALHPYGTFDLTELIVKVKNMMQGAGGRMGGGASGGYDSVLWLGNKAQNVWYETGRYLDDLIDIFPKR